MRQNLIFAATLLAALVLGGHSASAAEEGRWVFNPAKCPDLVEDRLDRIESRRDERVDVSRRDVREDRRDRRESRRDERVTRCPARAWEWQGPAYSKRIHPRRPRRVRVYYNVNKGHYYRRVGDRVVVISFRN